MTTKKRMNILQLVLDQIAPQFLPNYGHNVVKAPNIAGLSHNATTFDNAYTNSPLCVPSRVSMFTGQLPSTLNSYDTGSELPASVPTIAHYLRHSGYSTCLSGKAHFIGPDQMHGFEQRLTSDMCSSDFKMSGNWDKGEETLDWFHTLENIKTSGIAERATQQDHDEEVTHQAKQWLYDWVRQDRDRPFYLQVSLSHPHDPYVTPKRYWDRYEGCEIELPKTPYVPLEERDAYSAWIYRHYDRGEYAIDDEDIIRTRRAYFGNISFVDDLFGQVLDTLERIGEKDNTIIVLCADHGEMLGERGQWYKMTPFDYATRVPLIVKMPNQSETIRIKENVSVMDIVPTLLDMGCSGEALALQSTIESLDGKSLRCLLEDHTEEWHDVAISELMFEGLTAPAVMIRKGKYKYVHINPNDHLLFDMENDPEESNDLSQGKDYTGVVADFQSMIAERWDLDAITNYIHLDQRRRLLIQETHYMGRRHVSWDYQPFKKGADLYHRSHVSWLEADKRDMFRPKTDFT